LPVRERNARKTKCTDENTDNKKSWPKAHAFPLSGGEW
jgi:hypothetical protein